MSSEPQFAEGFDPEQLRPQLNGLQDQGWRLDEDKIGIKKTFYFRSYFKAVVSFFFFFFFFILPASISVLEADVSQSFLNVIASQSATKKHHATMTVVSHRSRGT
jgi:4a-hydroxytetrahydrobiopterin dehydratase